MASGYLERDVAWLLDMNESHRAARFIHLPDRQRCCGGLHLQGKI